MTKELNPAVFNRVKEFRQNIEKKGVTFHFSFPGYQDISDANNKEDVQNVCEKLHQEKFPLIGSPEDYVIPDSLTFNTPYHLFKKGVDLRTATFVRDSREIRGQH